jgi:uncharacterized protein (DUF1778 family)
MIYIRGMTSAPKDKMLTFRVPTADAARIQAAAIADNRKVADFVRLVVLEHIKEKPNA